MEVSLPLQMSESVKVWLERVEAFEKITPHFLCSTKCTVRQLLVFPEENSYSGAPPTVKIRFDNALGMADSSKEEMRLIT